MKNCAFTIVAKNYIGLAQILEKSILEHYTNLDFHIIVADEVQDPLRCKLPQNALIAKETLDISASVWNDMSFKYNLTEFCTSIKPASFIYLLSQSKYDKCIFLDPDICFYDSIGKIYDMLDDCQILITPHITRMENIFSGDYSERGIMQTGIFNLGFCGLKKSDVSMKMISWWHSRLIDKCFNDVQQGLFTDQKWMDMMPCYFGKELNATKHLGMNLAPWNFHEREIVKQDNNFLVKYRGEKDTLLQPLIFVHYSGFDYKKLKTGSIEQRNILEAVRYDDIDTIMECYANNIRENAEIFDRFIAQTYTYNFYANGDAITSFHRKLYRGLVEHNTSFLNPFETGQNTFHDLLYSKKMITADGDQSEKITKDKVVGVLGKLRLFNKLTRITYKLLGINKYLLLIRLMAVFSHYETQIHLLNKRFDSNNIDR